jgi:hypothetical protein
MSCGGSGKKINVRPVKRKEHEESLKRLKLENQKKEEWEKNFTAKVKVLQEEREHLQILAGAAKEAFDKLLKCRLCASKGYRHLTAPRPGMMFEDTKGRYYSADQVCTPCSCARGEVFRIIFGDYLVCPGQ